MFGDDAANYNPDASQNDVSQHDDDVNDDDGNDGDVDGEGGDGNDDKNNASPSEVEQEQAVETEATSDVTRQLSTTEYLSGMMCSSAPPGLLPLFSSWSLVCLGQHSLYIPSHGSPFVKFNSNILFGKLHWLIGSCFQVSTNPTSHTSAISSFRMTSRSSQMLRSGLQWQSQAVDVEDSLNDVHNVAALVLSILLVLK